MMAGKVLKSFIMEDVEFEPTTQQPIVCRRRHLFVKELLVGYFITNFQGRQP